MIPHEIRREFRNPVFKAEFHNPLKKLTFNVYITVQ